MEGDNNGIIVIIVNDEWTKINTKKDITYSMNSWEIECENSITVAIAEGTKVQNGCFVFLPGICIQTLHDMYTCTHILKREI